MRKEFMNESVDCKIPYFVSMLHESPLLEYLLLKSVPLLFDNNIPFITLTATSVFFKLPVCNILLMKHYYYLKIKIKISCWFVFRQNV